MKTFKKIQTLSSLAGLISLCAPLFGQASTPLTYDQMYPYYAEYCSVSTIVPLDGRGAGGDFGHSALYVKGLCKDQNAAYPRVRDCSNEMNMSDPNSGAGISVDNNFTNVSWMVVNGKRDFYYGDLPAGARLDAKVHGEVVTKLTQKGYFKGIRIKQEEMKNKPAGISDEQYIGWLSMGTSVALNFGRNTHCARIPLKKEMLPKMAEYLNSQNDNLVKSGQTYKWDQFFNNCAHLAYGALASVGLVPDKTKQPEIDVYTGRPVNDGSPTTSPLAIPGRVFAQLVEIGNFGSTNVLDIYQNALARKAFENFNWVGTQPGALYVYIPIRPASENTVYKTDIPINKKMWAFGKTSTLDSLEKEPRLSNLKANLEHFKRQYQREWQEYAGFGNSIWGKMNLRTDRDFRAFYDAYGQYLRRQAQMVDNQLASLPAQ